MIMIKNNNQSIGSIYYDGHLITKIYGCDGHLVWSGGTTPTGDKFKAVYLDSSEYTKECTSDGYLLLSETKPSGYDYTTMTDAIIGDCVTYIGHGAFSACTSLSSVTIPNSVTTISIHAFNQCTSLSSITIPNSVTSIGASAFYCAGLTSIVIPSSVTVINDDVFWTCTSLTSVTIPNSVTRIGVQSFGYCSSLPSITIPSSVTSIGNYAFIGCDSLTSITVEATTPPTLGTDVFDMQRTNYPIYVPSTSVNAYKSAKGWRDIASRIYPIP